MKKILLLFAAGTVLFQVSCKRDKEDEPVKEPEKINTLPEFYKANPKDKFGKTLPEFIEIANGSDQIASPQDLDFNPKNANELWIINKGSEATGSTTIIIKNAGLKNQEAIFRKDGNAWHFMSLTSALAFSNNGNWASSPNVLDANHKGGRYTGPSLWSSNLSIFAQNAGPGTNGSHLDMVHQSPYAMGIASEKDNVFWVFDGYYNNIIRYDFAADHGPGNDYHADAKLRRFTEVTVKRDPIVPSHMVLDKEKKWLYIVDGGNQRILRMDITTGSVAGPLPPVSETLSEYSRMAGVNWEVFYDKNLMKPCGIDIKDNRLFVSDYETGEIICIDVKSRNELARVNTGKTGITGIKIYNNRLWFVNATTHNLMQVNPK